MILSVHAIFGAAVASLIPSHPVAGFALGFASHFVLDAIPHKDYKLVSVESVPGEKNLIIDLIRKKFDLIRDIFLVSCDALVGLCLAFLFFFNPVHPWIFLLGALGSLIPDGLTFLYLIIKHKSLNLLFDFHVGLVHSKVILKLHQITGVVLQFVTLTAILALLFGVTRLL